MLALGAVRQQPVVKNDHSSWQRCGRH